MIRTLIVILVWVATGAICYNDGYALGFKHGKIDGQLEEIVKCYYDMLKQEERCQK